MSLTEILAAATDPSGGKWVLVVGAGSSIEPPTNLKTGGDYSAEAHRRLRSDGVLSSDCNNPRDLSEVADAVFAATSHQTALVSRLPRTSFRTASPNPGHLTAAALLMERSLAGMVTLNFDLAMTSALSQLGSGETVAVIASPNDVPHLSTVNLVYLHRNAEAPADEWVLRSAELNKIWEEDWKPVIASKILVAPTVVFAGLGSPAASLTETVALIKKALPNTAIRQVDPSDFGTLSFTAALDLSESHYIKSGWCDFMQKVGERVLVEHWAVVIGACATVVAERGYAPADLVGLGQACSALGLVGFGSARGRWLVHDGTYAPIKCADPELIADVILTIAFLSATIAAAPIVRDDGVVEFRNGSTIVATVGFASARGLRDLTATEAALSVHRRYWRWKGAAPKVVVVTGHLPSLVQPTTPFSIVGDVDDGDIVGGPESFEVISAYHLRANTHLVSELKG